MNYTHKAIQLAIDNGWTEHRGLVNNADYYTNTVVKYQLFLDPLFWQALGKTLGWDDSKTEKTGIDLENGKIEHYTEHNREWLVRWHHFVGHLAESKNTDDFFRDLLNERNH